MTGPHVAAVVLAGGRGSRLEASVPKPLVEIGGRPMIAHVLDRIPSSVSPVVVGANDPEAFAGLGLPIVPDRFGGFLGPLAALDAAAAWLRERGDPTTHLLCLPADTPFLPSNIAARLTAAAGDRPRLGRFGDRLHPTVALWPMPLLDTLSRHLAASESLSVLRFAGRSGFEPVDFAGSPEAPGVEPFFNVNTPDDLRAARAKLDER